jgi:hypothetical protein
MGMLGTRPAHTPSGHPLVWLVAVAATSAAALAAILACAAAGITSIVFYLAYVPVCTAAYRFRWRGLWVAGAVAIAYVAIIDGFFPDDQALLVAALIRGAVVCALAFLVAAQAWAGERAE